MDITYTTSTTTTTNMDNQTPTTTTNNNNNPEFDIQTETIWDRKTDGGFPETKELKRRVRDVIQPERNLGHVDRDYGSSKKPSTEAAPPPPAPVASASSGKTECADCDNLTEETYKDIEGNDFGGESGREQGQGQGQQSKSTTETAAAKAGATADSNWMTEETYKDFVEQ